jgi:transcription elongation factor GreB
MARALLGKQVDDEITVRTPTGEHHYLILEIAYRPLDQQDNG